MLSSLIADSLSFLLLLMAGFVGLFYHGGKSLANAIAWRRRLEYALEHGTHNVTADWPIHGLSYPVGFEGIEIELKKTRLNESHLRHRKKIVIVTLLILGAFFWVLARYLTTVGL